MAPSTWPRVRAWRADNPGHERRRQRAVQDHSLTQVVDRGEKTGVLTTPVLQEHSYAQALVLTGLIASLMGTALQEGIARSARRFQQLALDIFNGEPRHDEKMSAPPRVLRAIPSQFSWLDHRLVRERRLNGCSTEALALYRLLVTVADVQGLERSLVHPRSDLRFSRRFGTSA